MGAIPTHRFAALTACRTGFVSGKLVGGALSVGREVQYGVGLASAFARDACRAQPLAADLARRFPEDTVVQFNSLPTIHAHLALSHI